MKGLYGQFEENRFRYLLICMMGKQNQYSWSFRGCLENCKYMVCKYRFSLRTANKQHCDLQVTLWEASLIRLHKEWMEQCRDQSKRQRRSFQWAGAKGSDDLLRNERQRAACQRVLQKAHSSGIWKLPQIHRSSKFSQDYMEPERVLTEKNTRKSQKTSLSCKQGKMEKNLQWVCVQVNGAKVRATAVAVSPLSMEQTVSNRSMKTRCFPRAHLTTLIVKLISKTRGWSEETVSSHLIYGEWN